MEAIKTVRVGRLVNDLNFKDGFAFDNLSQAGYTPVVEVEFVNPSLTKYAIIIEGFACTFGGRRFVTHLCHVILVNGAWRLMDDEDIDKEVFSNMRSLIASMELFLDVTTGKFYTKGDAFMYDDDLTKEVLDTRETPHVSFSPKKYEKQTVERSNFVPYFKYLFAGTTGQSLVGMLTGDISNRLQKYVV